MNTTCCCRVSGRSSKTRRAYASFGDGKATVRWGNEKKTMAVGEVIGGWQLVAILPWLNGVATAVFEKHVTHQGAIVYVTEMGEITRIPKRIGDLSHIRPRPTSNPHNVKLERPEKYVPGPDVCGDYILNSDEDPCYENVAALGPEFIGWTLVANEEAGPERSLFLEADGTSRQMAAGAQAAWAPDLTGRLFVPAPVPAFRVPLRVCSRLQQADVSGRVSAGGGYRRVEPALSRRL